MARKKGGRNQKQKEMQEEMVNAMHEEVIDEALIKRVRESLAITEMVRKGTDNDVNPDKESSSNPILTHEKAFMENPVTKDKGKTSVEGMGLSPCSYGGICEDDELILSHEKSIQELINSSREQSKLSQWLGVMNKANMEGVDTGGTQKCSIANKSNGGMFTRSHFNCSLKLHNDDVNDELVYWKSCIVAFVMGLNPSIGLMDGFARRLWGKENIDRVIFVKRGVFLIRFLNDEAKEKDLLNHHVILDGKPVILRQWEDKMDYDNRTILKIPVWVQLHNLPLKLWGMNCLSKIVGLFGRLLSVDSATRKRDGVGYARILVEMDLEEEFTNSIQFLDEKNEIVCQNIHYEWRPLKCPVCKEFGHSNGECRRKEVRMVWRPRFPSTTEKESLEPHDQNKRREDKQDRRIEKVLVRQERVNSTHDTFKPGLGDEVLISGQRRSHEQDKEAAVVESISTSDSVSHVIHRVPSIRMQSNLLHSGGGLSNKAGESFAEILIGESSGNSKSALGLQGAHG